MCGTWCATVRSESDRRAATTRLGAPRAARRSTSTSRAVSPAGRARRRPDRGILDVAEQRAGEVEVAGLVPWRQRERNALNIGVVFGQRSQLWWDRPLVESFKLVRAMYRLPEARYRRNLDRCAGPLRLGELLDRPVRQLSLGQRMRGDLAAAMLYEPRP